MKIAKMIKDWIFFNFDLPLTDDYFEVECTIYKPMRSIDVPHRQFVAVPKTLIDVESYYTTMSNVRKYLGRQFKSKRVILEDFIRNKTIDEYFKVVCEDNHITVVPRY